MLNFYKDDKDKKWLIIPVEVKYREFESRLLLALYAASKGYGVIFGSSIEVARYLKYLPRGIFFDKSISKNKYNKLKNIIHQGYVLTAIDEEGLGSYKNTWLYLKARISKETLSLVPKIFVWGQSEADVIAQHYPAFENKIEVTGNPRVDIWKSVQSKDYKNKIQSYKKRYGKYILMPTSFGAKHAENENFLVNQAKDFRIIENDEDEIIFKNKLEYRLKTLHKFAELVVLISQHFPEYSIILRPHPSEDHNYWKQKTSDFSNVFVVYEDEITPWILGSDLVIHSSCTTGLESFLLDKPVISYLPYKKDPFIKSVSNELSICRYTEEEVVNTAKEIIKLDKYSEYINYDKLKLNAQEHLASLNSDFAYERIVHKLDEIELGKHSYSIPFTLYIKYLKREIGKLIKGKVKSDYQKQKNPGILLKEINYFIKNNKFISEKTKVHKIVDNLYLLEKPNR